MNKKKNINEYEIQKMYKSGMSVYEIGEKLGFHGTLIHSRLKRMGLKLRSLSEAQKVAHKTGRAKSMFKPMDDHPYWKGGKTQTGGGHILLKIPNHPSATKRGCILEHRYVWEKTYNKKIPRGYDIHHLNGIKTDNRPENLIAIKHNEHRNLSEPFKKRIRELEIQIEQLKQGCLF